MAETERRKSVRIKKIITVRYSYGIGDEKKWDMTVIRDISETGMCVTTHKQFFPEDTMAFLVKIPSRPLEWMEFIGRVVGSEKLANTPGMSFADTYLTRVEFVNLQDSQKESIREYIAWFLAKEGGGKR